MSAISIEAELTPHVIRRARIALREIANRQELAATRLLDVGCERGVFAHLFCPNIDEYVGLDRSTQDVVAANENKPDNASFLAADMTQIPFGKSFDAVFFGYSFHFWDPIDTLKMAKGITRDEGTIVIIEPTIGTEWKQPHLRSTNPFSNRDIYERKIRHTRRAKAFLDRQPCTNTGYVPGSQDKYWVIEV